MARIPLGEDPRFYHRADLCTKGIPGRAPHQAETAKQLPFPSIECC